MTKQNNSPLQQREHKPKREPITRTWFLTRGYKKADTPKGARTPEQQAAYNRSTVTFFDIDKKAWRSMRIDCLWSYQRALKLTE